MLFKEKKLLNFLKRNEGGAAELVEAAFIYPVVFLALFVLIYVGLYIMQYMTVDSYTQKIAMLAAREVSCPGYIRTSTSDSYGMIEPNMFTTVAAEGEFKIGEESDGDAEIEGLHITFKPSEVNVRAYRYWMNPLGDDAVNCFTGMVKELASQNSILCAGNIEAKVECENLFIAQFINVSMEQKLASFAVLDFFGIEAPSVKATAKVSVSDTDELVRNTDFVVDSLVTIAKKFGVDVDKVKDTIAQAKEKLGLN